jgi:xanthine/CO dehydrogenase XdhC/CoxF family maturation factor
MAAMLGWSVVVVDGREQLARPERFPGAERVASTPDLSTLGVCASDAVVLMTHSYEQDRQSLVSMLALDAPPRYVGLLGAKHRSSLLVSEAASILGRSVGECCDRIYAPMGLDLGGDGAEAIALAVISEVHACVEGRIGISRRLSAEDVLENVARGGISRYLQTQCAM